MGLEPPFLTSPAGKCYPRTVAFAKSSEGPWNKAASPRDSSRPQFSLTPLPPGVSPAQHMGAQLWALRGPLGHVELPPGLSAEILSENRVAIFSKSLLHL